MLYWNREKLIIGTTNEVNVLILDQKMKNKIYHTVGTYHTVRTVAKY